ncbi:hypothetical protein AKJ65_01550 [candidate division MSBL1 archaeon SCGC-AAA259E19]|uniref:Uncharacterized protein n=1 Tax=candidate division MSBL1 archaeon SCGC-AAA259E19 TaxID=1698264 RepID=A0A133UN15_9EURY|nr:hypothetical protein AKJ65_01550 [candidate division MSBL1 archaeon SCGC-AAA259E19]
MEVHEDNDFLKTEITFAVVLRADVGDVQQVKEYLDGFDDLSVIYQKSSGGKLYIKEKGEA